MPALCDSNLLLALCYGRHNHHGAALAWLDAQGERSAVLCRPLTPVGKTHFFPRLH